MPKSYSEKERKEIVKTLKREAAECLKLYGVRKTTVDELVKRTKIPKGTFYLFYPSKELLLFEVINDFHNEIQNELISQASDLGQDLNADKITDLLLGIFKKVSDLGFIELLTSGDMDILMRKLPEQTIMEHLKHDDFNVEQLISIFPTAKNKNIAAFSGAFRAIFLSMKYKREIGYECFDDALKILIQGLVNQLCY